MSITLTKFARQLKSEVTAHRERLANGDVAEWLKAAVC